VLGGAWIIAGLGIGCANPTENEHGPEQTRGAADTDVRTSDPLSGRPDSIVVDQKRDPLMLAGMAMTRRGVPDSALVLLDSAFARCSNNGDTLGMADACIHQGRAWAIAGRPDSALVAYRKALDLRTRMPEGAPPTIAGCYAIIAALAYNNDIDSCRKYLDLADSSMRFANATLTERYIAANVRGLLLWNSRELNRAQLQFANAIGVLNEPGSLDLDLDPDWTRAKTETNLCNVFDDLHDFRSATEHGSRSLVLLDNVLAHATGSLRIRVLRSKAILQTSLGSTLVDTYEIDSALTQLKSALNIYQTVTPKGSRDWFLGYWNISHAYYVGRGFDLAEIYLDSAKIHYRPGAVRADDALFNALTGALLAEHGDRSRTMAYYEESFRAATPAILRDTNGLPDPYVFPTLADAANMFDSRASALERVYEVSGDREALALSIATYDKALSVIELITSTSDLSLRAALASGNWDSYRGALRTNLRAYETSHVPHHIQRMLEVMEASRNMRARGQGVGVVGKLPTAIQVQVDSLTALEDSISTLRSALIGLDTVVNLSTNLDNALRTEAALHKAIASTDPKLHNKLYGDRAVSLSTVQASLVQGEVLVEFFLSVDNLYALWIRKDTTLAQHIALDSTGLSDAIVAFKSGLLHGEQPDMHAAVLINSIVLEPALRALRPSSLVIVPDGQLYDLPFEAIVTSARSGSAGSIRYLQDDVTIRYAPNALDLINARAPMNDSILAYGGFAPVEFAKASEEGSEDPSASISELVAMLRSGRYGDLPNTADEIDAASSATDGESYFREDADERTVRSKAGQFGILHFATHAFADQEHPERSGLVMHDAHPETKPPSGTDGSDNILYASEISTLPLRADLVVLSGCETGTGHYARGEGVQSLARAFNYAGVPNVVSSLWKVDDRATKEIMVKFYEKLAEGMGKADALAEAKRWYREEYPNAPPSHWAAFILIGDNEPVRLKKRSPGRPWMWGGAVTAVIAAMAARRRRQRARAA